MWVWLYSIHLWDWARLQNVVTLDSLNECIWWVKDWLLTLQVLNFVPWNNVSLANSGAIFVAVWSVRFWYCVCLRQVEVQPVVREHKWIAKHMCLHVSTHWSCYSSFLCPNGLQLCHFVIIRIIIRIIIISCPHWSSSLQYHFATQPKLKLVVMSEFVSWQVRLILIQNTTIYLL